jgi:hypothetical protein
VVQADEGVGATCGTVWGVGASRGAAAGAVISVIGEEWGPRSVRPWDLAQTGSPSHLEGGCLERRREGLVENDVTGDNVGFEDRTRQDIGIPCAQKSS